MKLILITIGMVAASVPSLASDSSSQSNVRAQTQSETRPTGNQRIPSSTGQKYEGELAYREEYRPETLRQTSRDQTEQKEEDLRENARSSARDFQMYGREVHEHHDHY